MIDDFTEFYNHKHIQFKTGVAPLSLRHSAYFLFVPTSGLFSCPFFLGQFSPSRGVLG